MASGRPETVTVVFTDLVGSTAWRTSVGELVADEQTAQLERASREVVTAAGGSVVKGTGDGVMATFASASVALDAAAALQHVARRSAVGGTAACLRVGVSTGEMVRQGEDWLGAAAIEASRLCADAEGGTVLVADITARLGRGRTDHGLRSIGRRTLRGFDQPIEVFELIPAATRPSALPAPLARAASVALVGRTAEQSQLDAKLKAVAAGATATILLVGEPGVGKTRLAAAAATIAAEHGLTVLHGRCDDGSAAPYQPFVEALAPWLDGLPDVALRRLAGDDGGLVANLWPELATRLPDAPRTGEPEAERWRLFEAITTILRSFDEPLLLVIDDLQWAEPSTRALLGHMVRRAVPSLAIVGTARRGGDLFSMLGDLDTGVTVDTVELAGLEAGDVTELVASHVGHRPPDELARHLWRQTDGNPFFLGALLDHLDHVTTIRDDGGTWATAAALGAVGVPHDVRAVVRRRLAVLGDGARQAIDVAAVCGLAFDEVTVRGVVGSGIDDNVEAIDEATAVGLVREEGTGRYAFVHALVRDTVIADLSGTRLARLHWRAGEELDRRPDRAAHLDEVAAHFAAAGELGDPAIVLRASLEAGDDAMARLAFEEAAGHFRTALATLDRLSADPDVRYRVLTSLGQALNALAESPAPDPVWLEAAAIAEAAEDPRRILDALVGYDLVVRLRDQGEVLARLLDTVLRLVGPGDSPLRARALAWRETPSRGAMRRAPDPRASDEAVSMARRTGDASALASTLKARMAVMDRGADAEAMLRDAEELATPGLRAEGGWLLTTRQVVRALLRLGRRAEADARLAENLLEAERSGLRMAIIGAVMTQSAIAIASGDFAAGKRMAAEAAGRPAGQLDALALAHAAQLLAIWYERGRTEPVIAALDQLERDDDGFTPWVAMLSSVLAETGQLDRSGIELRRVMPRLAHGFVPVFGGPVAVRYVAEACRRLDLRSSAEHWVAHVAPWTGTLLVAHMTIEGAADRSLGHLLATTGRLDEAIDAYAAGSELERRAGFPPLHARTGYWHARTLLERDGPGDREQAAALLDETIEIAERLGMRLLHQQAKDLSNR
jgi:class 3 adenylate cyclase/tetratricopeptide (TPR) repeat protein